MMIKKVVFIVGVVDLKPVIVGQKIAENVQVGVLEDG
jgi:hypothetical protein